MLHKDGSFSKGLLSAVPYRHHSTRWLWHVVVIDGSERIGLKIIASRAAEAATKAIDRVPWFKAEKSARAKVEALRKKELQEIDSQEEPEEEGDEESEIVSKRPTGKERTQASEKGKEAKGKKAS
jgi:hypothetical protein